jgi:hypothetical protein
MRTSTLSALVMVAACDLSLLVAASLAQQAPRPGTTSPARPAFFTRIQTKNGVASPASGNARLGSRAEITRSLEGRDTPRPYERAPVVSPPERTISAPVASHNYYPGLRPGQGPNRNAIDPRSLCVPGRRAFLHR